jgi:hypothetical protein
MKYDNRFYPHPVLGIRKDVEGDFSCQLIIESDKNETIITPKLKLENDDLQKLIDSQKASFCMQLYCRGTLFREVYKIKDPVSFKLRIPSTKINEETEADFFICAEEEIYGYKNAANEKGFEQYCFNIEKGDILAYGGKGVFYANKAPEELKSVSSIMNIRNSGVKNGPFFIDYDGSKITVNVSESDYDLYQVLKTYTLFIPVIHSSLVFPALFAAICFIEYEEASEQFRNYDWYKIISKRLEETKGNSNLEKVQNILDLPVNRTLIALNELFEE